MHIGQYEIVRTLGKGGMGAVYVARDPAIDRLVAIKLLRDGIDSPEVRERFKREARSAGKLRHPNIVTIFHVGDHEARPYIVMEYIPGETLAEIIRQETPLTIARKLRIIEEVCRGLAYAHKFGIVHRDVKPLNILVDTEGAVKILDFGIARVGDQGLTQLGMMMGTPNYMSPEQISPGRADYRSDVFAVGLVLYELLTYRRAFPGDDFSVLQKILQSEPEPIEKYCPGIDPEIVQVLNRALAKKPDDRYQDLAAMRQDIVRIWSRLRTPEDEGSGDIAPSTPPETVRYDGPTLVPGPNEQPPAPATNEQRRAADLARELARVAEEKRRAEESAHTPALGTPQPTVEPTRVLPPDELAKLEEARAEQRRKSAEAAQAAERARRTGEARQAEIRAADDAARTEKQTPTPAPPAPPADPTRTGPKARPPVTYASTSEPTVFIRRAPSDASKPAPPKPGSGPQVSSGPGSVPPVPPKGSATPVPPGPPVPKHAPPAASPAATTQNLKARPAAQPAGTSTPRAKAMPAWLIPVGAAILIALLVGLRVLLGGSSPEPAAPPGAEQGQTVSPVNPQGADGTAPGATTPAGTAAQNAELAGELRARVGEALGRGDVAGALGVLEGQLEAADPAIAAVAATVLDAAKSAATTSFEQAQAAGAVERPSDEFRNGLTRRADADAAATTGQTADAARGYLEASALFAQAATNAQAPLTPPPAPAPSAADRPPARPPSRPQPSRAADTASIQTLLGQYADAYSKMDVSAVRAVWPGAPSGLSFAGNRAYAMSLRSPQLRLDGDDAVVTAVRHTVQELENGQKRETSVNVTMTLRRVGGGWVIDTIQ